MKLYRVEKINENIKEEFSPMIPKNVLSGGIEDSTIPRICVSNTIEGCLGSVTWGGYNIETYLEDNKNTIRVYEFKLSDINKNNLITPEYLYEKDLVRDAVIHDEYWIINQKIIPSKVYNLKINSISIFGREVFSYDENEKIKNDISYMDKADVFMAYEIQYN